MQRVNCAAGAVLLIGHLRTGTVDIPVHIGVDFPVAFVQGFTYCGLSGLSGLAAEISCGPSPETMSSRTAARIA